MPPTPGRQGAVTHPLGESSCVRDVRPTRGVFMVGDWLVVMVGDWLVVMVGDLRAGCRSSQRGCMVHGDAWCAVRDA